MDNNHDLIRRLAFALDGAMDQINRKAEAEKSREEGKAMRQVTEQMRATMARKALDEAFSLLEIERSA